MKKCRKCHTEKTLTAFHRDSKAKDGRRSLCKVCARAATRVWEQENAAKVREKNQRWRRANRTKARAASRRWNAKNPEKVRESRRRWYAANKDKSRESGRRYYAKNKAVFAEKKARRRAAKLQATPEWLTPEDISLMQSVYGACPKDSHVDHIVPLCGTTVCGLHVPWNLQHLPALTNMKKGNHVVR